MPPDFELHSNSPLFIVGAERNHPNTKINTTHRGALHAIYFKYEAMLCRSIPCCQLLF